jgi:hypothetical protein
MGADRIKARALTADSGQRSTSSVSSAANSLWRETPTFGEHALEGGARGLLGDAELLGRLARRQPGADQRGDPRLAQREPEHVAHQVGRPLGLRRAKAPLYA